MRRGVVADEVGVGGVFGVAFLSTTANDMQRYAMSRKEGGGAGAAADSERAARMTRALGAALVLLVLTATALVAQDVQPLGLDEAIRLAKRNNPTYRITANDQAAADWGVREAYGNLLPSVNAGGSASYTEAGVQRF